MSDIPADPRSFHDADETLQAIHRGDVDALVVIEGLKGPQVVILQDTEERRRAGEVVAAERFARSILEQATEAIVVLDQYGRITRASRKAEQLAGRSPVGIAFSQVFPLEPSREAEPGMLARFSAPALDTLLASKPVHGVEVRLQRDGLAHRVFLLSAGPLLDGTQASVGSIVTLTEITEQKHAEEHQAMLVAELNHRVKNILTVVQAMAYMTIRSSDSLAKFDEAFSGRLRALALAYGILTQTRWVGTGLADLIGAVLKPHRPGNGRVVIDGPAVLLPGPAMVPLSMTLHELTTNAIKYGALSTLTGRIEITWKLVGDGADQSVDLIWRESGGPRVERREASGFGTSLIDRVVGSDLGGTVEIDLDPAGICCGVKFPLRGGGGALTAPDLEVD